MCAGTLFGCPVTDPKCPKDYGSPRVKVCSGNRFDISTLQLCNILQGTGVVLCSTSFQQVKWFILGL